MDNIRYFCKTTWSYDFLWAWNGRPNWEMGEVVTKNSYSIAQKSPKMQYFATETHISWLSKAPFWYFSEILISNCKGGTGGKDVDHLVTNT